MQFEDLERIDGCRFSWNVWPTTKLHEARLSVPISMMYSPIKSLNELMLVPYKPSFCTGSNCGAILNPYCQMLYDQRLWVCNYCQARNSFGPTLSQASAHVPAPEVHNTATTIEYILDPTPAPPVFLFVVDTCIIDEELEALKKSIKQALLLVPDDALIGLISFGRDVSIYELSFDECVKSHLISGNKETTVNSLMSALGLKAYVPNMNNPEQKQAEPTQTWGINIRGKDKFLVPAAEGVLQMNIILDNLVKDPWTYASDKRPIRASGSAMKIGLQLLEATYKGCNARMITFIGGPPTKTPGSVVSDTFADPIRSHHDIQRDNAPMFHKACEYYTALAAQAANNGHVVDIFACCLDQVGLAEMQSVVNRTGGNVVLDDSFTRGVFQGSLKRMFAVDVHDDNHLTMGFNAEVQVLTSKELKVEGAVGHLTSLNRNSVCVASTTKGIGKTCAWRLGGIDQSSTLALFFTLDDKGVPTTASGGAGGPVNTQSGFIQIATKYRHASGSLRVRVTTIGKQYMDMNSTVGLHHIKLGFDQEAAASLITRLAISKLEDDPTMDCRRWIDRHLIKLCVQFAEYTQNNAQTFKLSNELIMYPQFMFHLRRSQLLQIFNCSPDETSFFRMVCLREDTNNTITMIQPRLYSYKLDAHPEPVLLDSSSLSSDRILLLDTFFHVIVWLGGTIAKWRQEGHQNKPEFSNFKNLLTAPLQAAHERMSTRFPTPRFIECVENGSQSRFLLAKVNPSCTPQENMGGEASIFSEDVSLKTFHEHLKRLVVAQPKP